MEQKTGIRGHMKETGVVGGRDAREAVRSGEKVLPYQ